MNALERKLIELTYPTVDADLLMQVIGATSNPRVATEILCGVYMEPQFAQQKVSSNDTIRTFAYFDKWGEHVHYTYEKEEVKYEYFPKTVDKNTITAENYKSLACSYNDDAYRHGVPTGKMEIREDYCTIKEWDKLKDVEVPVEEIELPV